MSLTLKVGDETRLFGSDGTVALLVNDAPQTRGEWRSASLDGEARDNRIRYTFDGTDQEPVAVDYAFNENNQLTAAIHSPAGDVSEPFAFPGRIEIDDKHDLLYRIVDATGTDTGVQITVYGDVSFDQDTNDLLVTLAGGGTTKIVGENGIQSVEAAQNHILEFRADDLLVFRANTINTMPDQPDAVILPAKVEFVGRWDIQQDGLKFISTVKGDITKPEITLGFAGKIGAVAAGFVYFADKDGTSAAFNIQGRHVFRTDAGESELNWETSLGFSQKKFTAKVTAELDATVRPGETIKIKGGLSLRHEDGTAAADSLALELEATYAWENNTLVLRANVDEAGGELNYDLQLQGDFKYDGFSLKFEIKYTSDSTLPRLHLELANRDNEGDLVSNLALALDINEDEARVSIDLKFELEMRWADGVRLKTKKAA